MIIASVHLMVQEGSGILLLFVYLFVYLFSAVCSVCSVRSFVCFCFYFILFCFVLFCFVLFCFVLFCLFVHTESTLIPTRCWLYRVPSETDLPCLWNTLLCNTTRVCEAVVNTGAWSSRFFLDSLVFPCPPSLFLFSQSSHFSPLPSVLFLMLFVGELLYSKLCGGMRG